MHKPKNDEIQRSPSAQATLSAGFASEVEITENLLSYFLILDRWERNRSQSQAGSNDDAGTELPQREST